MITIAQLVLNNMKKLILLLSLVCSFGAQKNVSEYDNITSPGTNVLFYIIKNTGSGTTGWSPYNMTPTIGNLESITGKDIITLDEINSQANFEAKVGWTIVGGSGNVSSTNGGTNKLTFYLGATNISATAITVSSLTNLSGIGTLSSFSTATTDTNQAGGYIFLDLDQTHATGIGAPDVVATNNYVALPTFPFTAILMLTNTGSSNMAMVPLSIGTNLLLTNGVLSSTASGSGGNWTASGTTNSVLAGIAYAHQFVSTNGFYVVGTGPAEWSFGDTNDSQWFIIASSDDNATNTAWRFPPHPLPTGSLLKIVSNGTYTNKAGIVATNQYLTNAIAGTDYLATALANTVLGSGTTAANDIAVFTDITHTNIARSTSAGTVGDASSATYTWTFNLSGASDPTLTAANALLTISTPLRVVGANDTTALTVNGGSVTGSGTTPSVILSGTLNTSASVDGYVQIKVTNTASAGGTEIFTVFGGAAGATELFKVDTTGATTANGSSVASTFTTGVSSGGLTIVSRGALLASADGAWYLRNAATTGFTSLSLGPDDASPNNASLKGASGVGTDIAGGTLTIAGGQSTGTGRGGAVIFQTSTNQATGSTLNGYTVRGHYAAKAVTLTETTATTVVTIPVPAAGFVGGSVVITVFASDGTDHQTRTLTVPWSAVNKAGTVTAGIGTPVESVAVSTGTLTATLTAVANSTNVDIKVDATSSLTQTTLSATVALPAINSNGPATITEI